MRVTFNAMFRNGLDDINRAASALSEAQRDVSTLKRLHTASDDPAGASTVVAERTEMRNIDQYVRATDGVDSRLRVTDSVLSDLLLLLEKAQTTTAASRNSFLTSQQRDALALQLEGTRDAILSDMNAKFRRDFLFSGSRLDTAPYTKTAGVVQPYAGDDRRLLVDIDRNHPVEVTLDGDSLMQGTDAVDLFAEFDALIAAVRAGDDVAMAAGGEALARAHGRVTTAQSRVGQVLGDLEAHRTHLTALGRASNERRAAVEDTNLAEAASRMQQADTAYQAALASVGATSRLTLLDYIR